MLVRCHPDAMHPGHGIRRSCSGARSQLLFEKPLPACVVEIQHVLLRGPDGSQPHTPRSLQQKLQATGDILLLQRNYLQIKLIWQQAFVMTERLVDM